MVDTRRSAAAKRRASSEEASLPADAPPPVEAASPPRSRSGKRAKAERTEAAAGAKAAAVDVLDSSVDNLQDMARSTAAVAASPTVSNSGGWVFGDELRDVSRFGHWGLGFGLVRGDFSLRCFAGSVKKKRTSYLPSTEGVTLWKTRQAAASGRSEAWGRLISQSSEYPSVPIYSTHFTVGHGGKYDLRLTESSPGSLVCKLKHVRRGASLDIYVSKVVHVNGKALDKVAKVTLIGGDEVIFSSLGRHAYIFQKLPEEKTSASTFSSSCVIQQGQYPVIKGALDHLSSKGAKLSVPFNFGNGRPPLVPHDTDIVSSLCKTMEDQCQFNSEESVPFAQHQLLKEDLKKAIVNASDISESLDSFPYYLSENTKSDLLSSAYVNLCCKKTIKWTKHISSLCQRVLLSGPAGSEIYQETLVKSLTKYFGAKLLIVDSLLLSGGHSSKAKESESYKKGDRVRYIGSLQSAGILLDGQRILIRIL